MSPDPSPRDRARGVLVRALSGVARIAPAGVGPQRWQAFVRRTRRVATEGTEGTEGTGRAVPLPVDPETAPRTQADLDRATAAVKEAGDHERASRLLGTVREQAPALDRSALSDLVQSEDISRVLEARPEDIETVLAEVRAVNPDALRPITRALTKHGAWTVLATQVTELAPDLSPDRIPTWLLTRAAKRSFSEGYLTASIAIAAPLLAAPAPDVTVRANVDSARDALALEDTGWPGVSDGPGAAHERRPDAVLSLLGQSLPLRSSGYATRSHGILTALTARGWSMRAATRLGFPYDLWWKPDDPRPVADHDVVDGVPYHRLLIDGVREYPLVPLTDYVAQGAERAAALGREHGASLVHASSLHDVGLLGMETAARLDVPFIYEMRGLKQLLDESRMPRFRDSERDRYLARMELTVAQRADRVLVITRALGDEMVRWGVDPERIVVVPNGVHVARFEPRPADTDLQRELGLQGRTVIGYVGALVNYEGLDLLLDAIDQLRRTRSDFHLLVVGDGISEKRLHRHAADLGLQDWVTFTGRVPHEEVERYLSLVDIAPFPRLPQRVSELISPIKPFESMAMAKAVVVSDVAALAEIVQDGHTGRWFRKGDAADLARVLGDLIEDPTERERLGTAARAWVSEHHDWATITGRIDAAYRDVLGRGSEG